ncbi:MULTISPECIES: C1 family peptidase [Aquimarina]|uniref:C1 family peptidase n=1 Tax=Aquimarina TaxID=290174 RepID=UPI000942E8AB|nr:MULTISPECIES: C1 family peptidase [Aquimarina]
MRVPLLKTFLIVILISTTSGFAQLPCKFSWKEVKTSSGVRDFTTPARDQIFQGPCMSHAFNAVIETMYMIEYNENVSIPLSNAYLYMGAFSTNFWLYEDVLEDGFKIPAHKYPSSYIYNDFIPNVDDWFSPAYNGYRGKALECISEERDFRLREVGEPPVYKIDNQCGQLITNSDYFTVRNVSEIGSNSIRSINDIKRLLIDGPMIMKVKHSQTNRALEKFGEYSSSELTEINDHAYAIIGWDDLGNNTQWILKDSWPKKAGYIKTQPSKLSNTTFLNLIASGDVSFCKLSGVVKNNKPTRRPRFEVDENLQCPPELSRILVDVAVITINGKTYSKAYVSSNTVMEDWQWQFSFSRTTRSEIKQSKYASIMVSPLRSGMGTIKVRGKSNGVWTEWTTLSIYLPSGDIGPL